MIWQWHKHTWIKISQLNKDANLMNNQHQKQMVLSIRKDSSMQCFQHKKKSQVKSKNIIVFSSDVRNEGKSMTPKRKLNVKHFSAFCVSLENDNPTKIHPNIFSDIKKLDEATKHKTAQNDTHIFWVMKHCQTNFWI